MVPNTLPVVIWAETGSALKTVSATAAVTVKTPCIIATPPDLTWTVCSIRDDDRQCTMPQERHLPGCRASGVLRSRHIQNLCSAGVKKIRVSGWVDVFDYITGQTVTL